MTLNGLAKLILGILRESFNFIFPLGVIDTIGRRPSSRRSGCRGGRSVGPRKSADAEAKALFRLCKFLQNGRPEFTFGPRHRAAGGVKRVNVSGSAVVSGGGDAGCAFFSVSPLLPFTLPWAQGKAFVNTLDCNINMKACGSQVLFSSSPRRSLGMR